MEDFDEILSYSAAGIERRYFLLPLAGAEPVYRERVYCYELYHQIRLRWPSTSPLSLSGEVDKSGHPLLVGFNEKPDFLIHTPGDMRGNKIVMEVKPITCSNAGIAKDIETLSKFVSLAGYVRAILLFYGSNTRARQDLDDRVRELFSAQADTARIEVWQHAAVGRRAVRIAELDSQVVRQERT